MINEFGGDIPETYGVPVEQVVEGIKHGVRKVNIDTDLRLASTGSIRRSSLSILRNLTRENTLPPAEAMKAICIDRYEAFGTAGNASKITPLSLAEMQTRYAA